MVQPPACTGEHTSFDMPAEPGEMFGVPDLQINGPVMGTLISAAHDRCQPCQARYLDAVARDPLTAARVVSLAAVAIQGLSGGLTENMTTEDDSASTFTAPFRAIIRAGIDVEGPQRGMYDVAAAMSDAERRQAVDDALDLIAGAITTQVIWVE